MLSNLYPQTKNTLLIKKIIIALTAVLLLISAFKWVNYSNDKKYQQEILSCKQTSGSHGEYNDCIVVPTRQHIARGNEAKLFTTFSFLVPLFGFTSVFAYSFFFLKKRD